MRSSISCSPLFFFFCAYPFPVPHSPFLFLPSLFSINASLFMSPSSISLLLPSDLIYLSLFSKTLLFLPGTQRLISWSHMHFKRCRRLRVPSRRIEQNSRVNIKTLLCSLQRPILSQTVGRSDNQMSLCKLDSPSDLQSLLKCFSLYCCWDNKTTGIVGLCPEGWVDYILTMFLCDYT